MDVDTPALREAKRSAQVEPCMPPDGPGSDLPELTLPCLGGGEEVVLADVSGPAVLPLWASWCEPCKDEPPLFARVADDLEGRAAGWGSTTRTPSPTGRCSCSRRPVPASRSWPTRVARWPRRTGSAGCRGILWVREDGSATFRNDRVRSYEELTELVSSQLGLDVGPPG